MRRLLASLWLIAAPAAADWTFSQAEPVSGDTAAGVFPHLEPAGRRAIAVQGERVAVVWEDNRSGTPRAYLALKPSASAPFEPPLPLSSGKKAYEPAVIAFGDAFVAAWEQDGGLRMRAIGAQGPGPVQPLGGARAAQVTLHAAGERLFAAWVERQGRFGRIMVAPLTLADGMLRAGEAVPADAAPPTDQQLYPALAHAAGRVVVAWEDRRAGHTRLHYACSPLDALRFGTPVPLNEHPPVENPEFGRGGGVTRVALAGNGGALAAVWMDKRDFQGGYDTYGAVLGSDCRFGPNEKVQDMFGENTPQWHPAVAVTADGTTVAVWDDTRDGNPDLWLSERRDDGWSDDLAVTPAHGPGRQDNAAIAFDHRGRLHLAWLHAADGAPTRVMYAVGVREAAD
ncbi:MAG: hypothetical protein AB7U81_06775 [Thiohalomonadaceae bacterium]